MMKFVMSAIHITRFTSKGKIQEIKLSTCFDYLHLSNCSQFHPHEPLQRKSQSICSKSSSQCQKCGYDKGQCKGKVKCFKCEEEDHEGFDCNNDPKCSNCGQPHMASSKDCHFFLRRKEIQTKKLIKICPTLRHASSSLQLQHKLCSSGLKKRINQPE